MSPQLTTSAQSPGALMRWGFFFGVDKCWPQCRRLSRQPSDTQAAARGGNFGQAAARSLPYLKGRPRTVAPATNSMELSMNNLLIAIALIAASITTLALPAAAAKSVVRHGYQMSKPRETGDKSQYSADQSHYPYYTACQGSSNCR